MSIEYTVIKNQKGGQLIKIDNFLFRIDKKRNDSEYWKCIKNVLKCPVRFKRTFGQVHEVRGDHNHQPDIVGVLRRESKARDLENGIVKKKRTPVGKYKFYKKLPIRDEHQASPDLQHSQNVDIPATHDCAHPVQLLNSDYQQIQQSDSNTYPELQFESSLIEHDNVQSFDHRPLIPAPEPIPVREQWNPPVQPRTENACYSFSEGQVYPQEARRASGHILHYSKAMISKPAPFWSATAVINNEFRELNLTQFEGKYLVLVFYPLDFTFVCPTEIISFSDRVKDFKAINTEVIAISVDSPFTHLAWIKTPRKQGGLGPINIPLLSDLTHQIAKDYGVFLEDLGHALRGLFIVDPKGIMRQITMNDLPVGRSVDETLRLLQAFQYTDVHGEVCPANWKPGMKTIIPNPEEKLKYFSAVNEPAAKNTLH